MKIAILSDNNTKIDKYFLAEPALSFYIQEENKAVLFDCGYSNVFINNANKLNINLNDVDDIVFSHAHNDHTGGFYYLIQQYQTLIDLGFLYKKKNIIAHQDIFSPKIEKDIGNVGFLLKKEGLEELFNFNLSKTPIWPTSKLCFIGEIENNNSNCPEESSLVYISNDGLIIITGCSHSGVKNIIEQAKKVTHVQKVKSIIGGFHLINEKQEVLEELACYLKEQNIDLLYPCHCVDLKAKMFLAKYFNIVEVNTGDIINFTD